MCASEQKKIKQFECLQSQSVDRQPLTRQQLIEERKHQHNVDEVLVFLFFSDFQKQKVMLPIFFFIIQKVDEKHTLPENNMRRALHQKISQLIF